MDTIRDCTGRIVCKANASNGLIETKYCKLKIFVTITIGSTYTVIRDGITTHTRPTRWSGNPWLAATRRCRKF